MSEQIVFSLYDLSAALFKKRKLVFFSALFCGLLIFFSHLKKPVIFTAKGILKNKASQMASFSRGLGLTPSDFLPSAEDPFTLIMSLPILERVVRSLNLQGMICEFKGKTLYQRIYEALFTEINLLLLKFKQPISHISSNKILIPSGRFLKDPSQLFQCENLNYTSDIATTLKISFEDSECFTVFDQDKYLGRGQLSTPFSWKDGSFILSTKTTRNFPKVILLSLIPLDMAAKSLAKSLVISKDKKNPTIFYLKFSHYNRELAAKIVNESMMQFKAFSKEMSLTKSSEELSYLTQRKKEIENEYHHFMELQKKNLLKNFSLQLPERNSLIQLLHQTTSEMLKLKEVIFNISTYITGIGFADLDQMQIFITENNFDQIYLLQTTEHIDKALEESFCELEKIKLTLQQCVQEMDIKNTPTTISLIKHPFFENSWKKLSDLKYKILDANNWSAKEKEQLQLEFLHENDFLQHQMNNFCTSVQHREILLRKTIDALLKNKLALAIKLYEKILSKISNLQEKSEHVAMQEVERLEAEIKNTVYSKTLADLTQCIEEKQYFLSSLETTSFPLHFAKPPALPDSPRLFSGFAIGSLLGAVICSFCLLLLEVFLSPKISSVLLKTLGFRFFGTFDYPFKKRSQETVKYIFHALVQQNANTVLVLSSNQTSFISILAELFSNNGEHILIVDTTPTEMESKNTIQRYEKFSYLSADSHYFLEKRQPLEELRKNYNRIFIMAEINLHIEMLTAFADATIFCFSGEERLCDISFLTSKILCVHTPTSQTPISLGQLIPSLATLMGKNLNSQKNLVIN